MDLRALIDNSRTRARDTAKPFLWSDEEWTQYLNEAQNEAAERGQLILDIDSPDVCLITVGVGVASYDLHPSILKIKRAKLDLGSLPLAETSIEGLDAGDASWQTRNGSPQRFVENDAGSITLNPTPVAADALRLRVTRLPLCPMKGDKDKPEIAERYHFRMLDWALRCAYLKQDSETLDPEKASRHEQLFIAAFGERPDANVQRKRRDHRPRVVTMGTW